MHFLEFTFSFRNTAFGTTSSKDLIKAEIKVFAICGCYVIIGVGSSFSYALSSAHLPGVTNALVEYFECEQTHYLGDVPTRSCDRSELDQYVNPVPTILGFSLLALYPTITLIYLLRKKRRPRAKRVISTSATP